MKVCPLCEFIYEDEQSICDMDEALLVYDPAPSGLTKVAVINTGAPLLRLRWKRFAATVVLGAVLGTLLVLVFHVFAIRTQEQLATTAQKSVYSSTQVGGDSETVLDLTLPVPLVPAVGAPVAPATPVHAMPGTRGASPAASSRQRGDSPGAGAQSPSNISPARRAVNPGNISSLKKPSSPPSPSNARRPAENSRKAERAGAKPYQAEQKESRISSLLKKTGRLLKKTFRS